MTGLKRSPLERNGTTTKPCKGRRPVCLADPIFGLFVFLAKQGVRVNDLFRRPGNIGQMKVGRRGDFGLFPLFITHQSHPNHTTIKQQQHADRASNLKSQRLMQQRVNRRTNRLLRRWQHEAHLQNAIVGGLSFCMKVHK
ncbi:unnamed protein product [Protopolystoma xenopodis]|uniref:Uncharacterized protein n=1 Tax=Protopolystoma xenopodis TaxID=117903 RepID=A0A448X5R5_9PLAT|nr:unnamed protein product [Protopolystoma xenopodis]